MSYAAEARGNPRSSQADRVTAPSPLARYTAVNKATGRPIDVRVAHHFTVRGGLIVRFEQFVDTALVRDAMNA